MAPFTWGTANLKQMISNLPKSYIPFYGRYIATIFGQTQLDSKPPKIEE